MLFLVNTEMKMKTMYHFVFLSTVICLAKSEEQATIPECLKAVVTGLALRWGPDLT